MRTNFLILLLLVITGINSFSQEHPATSDNNLAAKAAKQGLKVKLNEKGSSFVKFGLGMQFWYRNGEMNPGTVNQNTQESITHYSDFALRRLRLSALVNFESKYYLYTQFGLTSQNNTNSNHRGMFFHDFWGKIRLAPKTYFGAGLHMWNGLSRLSNVSYGSIMTLDNPTFNFPNVNVSDEFVRQYGIFLQGQLGGFDYSFSLNQPILPKESSSLFNDQEIAEKENVGVAYNRYHSNFSYKGYVSYSFFEQEKVATTPFKSMSYFGKKGRFLNLGVGFQYTPEASGILNDQGAVDQHQQLGLAADLWYEQPLPNESALNLYSAYYNYDYGDNYLRTVGVMNGFAAADPAGNVAAQGPGISQYYMGTGQIYYLNLGYTVPGSPFNTQHKMVPFYAMSYKDFEGLGEASHQHDLGVHYLILQNAVKISAQYSTRPVYDAETMKVSDHKGWFIMQLQFKI